MAEIEDAITSAGIEVVPTDVNPNAAHFHFTSADGESDSGVPFKFYGTDTALYLSMEVDGERRKQRIDLADLIEPWVERMVQGP